jgi:UDP-glucose 4-epimerase
MKIVVTGGAGFIGSHLVDALLVRGDEVFVFDNFSTGREDNLKQAIEKHGQKLTVFRKDVCDESVQEDLFNIKPDVIFHEAAQMNVRFSVENPTFDAEKNVVGTVNMLEGARKAGCKRFLFASTGGAIYGEQETFPADENHPSHAECPYGVGKRAAELYLEYYARAGEMCCTALRYANVYGPRQNPKGEAGVVAIFIERILKGEKSRINGDGLQTRDFVYVGDVVNANLLASEVQEPGKFNIYNVGCATEISVLDIAAGLKKISELEEFNSKIISDVVFEHGPELPGEQRRSVVDFAKIKKSFSWSPKTNLKEGLLETVRSFAEKL